MDWPLVWMWRWHGARTNQQFVMIGMGAGRLGVVTPLAHEAAMDHGTDIAARDADIGKLAVIHVAEFMADAAALVPRTGGINNGLCNHLGISWIGCLIKSRNFLSGRLTVALAGQMMVRCVRRLGGNMAFSGNLTSAKMVLLLCVLHIAK